MLHKCKNIVWESWKPDLKTKYCTSNINCVLFLSLGKITPLNYVANKAGARNRKNGWKITDVSLLLRQYSSFFIQRAGTSAFAFSHPTMSMLCVHCFHCWLIRFNSQMPMSEWCSAFCIFYLFFCMTNMYVPLRMFFWYILWMLSVWMSMEA